jgi:hypothetical protein
MGRTGKCAGKGRCSVSARTNLAWVSGSPFTGYTLHVMVSPLTTEFSNLNGGWYTRYRAAQVLANAIKTFVRKEQQK